jgi:glutamate/tyrosine decarboxylase-like PLP-dependent enzyme
VPESAFDVQAILAGRASLLRDACERGVAYLETVADRPVAPARKAVEGLLELGFPLPERGLGGRQALGLLDEIGSPATVASNGPRYFGFVTGGALPAAQAAAWLSAAWDQNAALGVMSPVAARCGEVAIGWDAASQGLIGAPPVTVVVGAEVHATIRKALGIIGLGRDRAIVLPADSQGRIDARDLPKLAGPAIVCLQAGNVNTGGSDPFGPLIEWAAKYQAWVHVDGAFGLWAAASPATRAEVASIELADSWATDCHKWLNTTYDCGLALVADPGTLRRAMEATASYLPGSEAEAMGLTPQSSQRARGVEVWAVLASLGRDGVAELVDRCCRLARRFADGMRSAGFEVRSDVVLNQVLISFGPAGRTDAVIAAVQDEGTCWCGPTTWQGRRAMRVSVSAWSTTEEDIDRSIAAVRACALRPT